MACTYCGIPVALETLEHDSFVSGLHDFQLDKPTQNDGYAGTDTEYLQLPFQNPEDALPEIGVLSWPRGASRCATFYAVVGGTQLALIRTAVDANNGVGDLVLSDANLGHTITAVNMRLLPPLPIHKIGSLAESEKLYLLTLVDQRYDWREKTVDIPLTPGSWDALILDLTTALGISITVDTINVAYQIPSDRWIQELKPVPALLDAALASVGQKLVVALDGTVTSVKWQTATSNSVTQFDTIKIIIGGEIEQADLTRPVPEEVIVTFGKVIAGVIQDDPYSLIETLTSLSITEFTGVSGVTGNRGIINADFIYDGTTANIADCDLVAAQAAKDYYGWHLPSVDFTAPGILNWVPTGAEDLIEWKYQYGGKLLTRVVRGPYQILPRGGWNPAIPFINPIVRIIAATTSTGEYTHRYTVRQVYVNDLFDEEDVVVDAGFVQWTNVIELSNQTLSVSTSSTPSQGVYTLHTAPDGHYYIVSGVASGSGSGTIGSGGDSSFFARLTTSNGVWWKWVKVAPNAFGSYVDVGVESTAFNALPCQIDGTVLGGFHYANPATDLRVRMWVSTTAFSGGTQYEFLPIGMTDSTHPGLINLDTATPQTLGDGDKYFQQLVHINTKPERMITSAGSHEQYPLDVKAVVPSAIGTLTAIQVCDGGSGDTEKTRWDYFWRESWEGTVSVLSDSSPSTGNPTKPQGNIVGGSVWCVGTDWSDSFLYNVGGSSSNSVGGLTVRSAASSYSSGNATGWSIISWNPLEQDFTGQKHATLGGTKINMRVFPNAATAPSGSDTSVDGYLIWQLKGKENPATSSTTYYSIIAGTGRSRFTSSDGYAIDNAFGVPTDGSSGSLAWGATASGGIITALGSSTVPLASGGTGASLVDPNANVLLGWDDTDNAIKFLTLGSGLTYTHASHTVAVQTVGATGTFFDRDSHTITVTNGLITSLGGP